MTNDQTVKSAVLRSYRKDDEVSFVARVVSVNGPFPVKKREGGEFLKFEALLENYEREIVKVNAFGPQPSFQLQCVMPLNALVQLEKFLVTEAKYVSYRVGTLAVEFKYTSQSKVKLLQNDYVLPELPLSTLNDIRSSNNLRRRIQIKAERMVLDRENTVLIGNVLMNHPDEGDTLRMFCTIKGASLEKKEAVQPGVVMMAHRDFALKLGTTSRLANMIGPALSQSLLAREDRRNTTAPMRSTSDGDKDSSSRGFATVQQIEDPTGFEKVIHRVKCSLASPFELFGDHHLGRIFIEDGDEFLAAVLRVTRAPVSIENIPADTMLCFQGTVAEENDELVFTITNAQLKVQNGEAEQGDAGAPTVIVPDYEASDLERITERVNCFVVVKLAKRFEKSDDGYVGFVTMVDKRSMALKVLLLDIQEEWRVDLAVNSVLRMCGSVEKINRRYTITVGCPADFCVLEEGTDRKSFAGKNEHVDEGKVAKVKESSVAFDDGRQSVGSEELFEKVAIDEGNKIGDDSVPDGDGGASSADPMSGETTTDGSETTPPPSDVATFSLMAVPTASSDCDPLGQIMQIAGIGATIEKGDASGRSEEAYDVQMTQHRALKRENSSLAGFSKAMARTNGIPPPKRTRKN